MPSFTPPTTRETLAGDPLFSRYATPTGVTVIRKGGVYTPSPYPWMGELEGLREGVDFFLGGRDYTITDEVGRALAADGFDVDGLTPTDPVDPDPDPDPGDDPVGYGQGLYGAGLYGR